MFKKFKDKLAEEVKSSPQRIQQFAQAAQAAVTSASSSISDITNNDLFSIGDSDTVTRGKASPRNQSKGFQEVSLVQPGNSQQNIDTDFQMNTESNEEYQRQRRLSNSSFASDVSFRLPSYESPSMYHLQSDMEVSASEAEDRGFSGGTVNLDRVTKEQLYSAYRRTQDRCTKYKTQYADLARHYKLLERENAKAKNVLVETQDKALRRISELREQCSLEQSAKAHLETALRVEIEEKVLKIETLNTKLGLLQNSDKGENFNISKNNDESNNKNDNDVPLISLETDDLNNVKKTIGDVVTSEAAALSNKIEKMEQLLNKYKDSLKSTKEKNGQLTTELQILSAELDTKTKENEQLKAATISLTEARKSIQDLNETIEELQNKNNAYEFSKNKEISILEINYRNAQEEITQLREKIEVLSKREEEYAISLAENKLSIHKELESKEAEIKSLKDSLANSNNEITSLNIILNDYKNNISQFEEERSKLRHEINEHSSNKDKIDALQQELDTLAQKYNSLEQIKSKADEEYNCLQLQFKQETAEKLAMIDRNTYLENKNSYLVEENSKKSSQINSLENNLDLLKNDIKSKLESDDMQKTKEQKYTEEINMWKSKCDSLESEIQDEREELEKLQAEIEKLLLNHETLKKQNENLIITVKDLQSPMNQLKNEVIHTDNVKKTCEDFKTKISLLRQTLNITLQESKTFKQSINSKFKKMSEKVILLTDTANREIAQYAKVVEELQNSNVFLQNDVHNFSDQFKILNKKCSEFQKENETLYSKIKELESTNIDQLNKIGVLNDSNVTLNSKIEKLESDHIEHLKKIQELYDENKTNLNKLHDFAKDSEKLNETIKNFDQDRKSFKELANSLKQENEQLHLTNLEIEESNKVCKNELTRISNLYDEALKKITMKTTEQNEFSILKEDYDKKNKIINELEKRVQGLVEENKSLKNLSETISKSVSDIESELKEVRQSHSQIEIEKDHLNKVISELEKNDKIEKQLDEKNIQTNLYDVVRQTQLFEDSKKEVDQLKEEIKVLKSLNNNLTEEITHNKAEITKMEEVVLINSDRISEYDSLKEENKQLQTDIESLQSYMTKVSKENSQLNDKLRELIATNDSFPEKNDTLIRDLNILKSEVEFGKNKIEDLIRENSLLVEENLELKDQIISQTYSEKTSVTENNSSKNDDIVHKYNSLMDTKNILEKKLHNSEFINQTIQGNIVQEQSNNEKLRLSNEKLERRLDEALVSLRHLHSLQENTELEYLKNILYEYLTGSGTHSVTLAKVLSAVVKFDDRQTEVVMQKEKERQGLLRQLGII